MSGAALVPVGATAQSPGLDPTPAEIDAFLAADANKDALLQLSEFKTFVRLMADAGQPTARQVRMFAAYRFAFRITDKNRDRVVSPDELRAADDAHQRGEGAGHN
ncbi:hypothetical protein M3P21_01770 [Ruegeria sp. 2012CJ41-6]|uniref:EF-hand domain-containing protein n=1 Tax=Ruegeria spongiae TaxID=2942209 RepID=A0ABT0PZZ4_9RHOB|nr:hypothetical protein [Ruegeria spongiae]MCL6282244.1 hypothetical protein [Ruegeria spongiae]